MHIGVEWLDGNYPKWQRNVGFTICRLCNTPMAEEPPDRTVTITIDIVDKIAVVPVPEQGSGSFGPEAPV